MIFIVCLTIYSLSFDLMDRGCLAWHRDSIGYFFQTIIFLVCLLIFFTKIMLYMEQEYDDSPNTPIRKFSCFVFNFSFRKIDYQLFYPTPFRCWPLSCKVDLVPTQKYATLTCNSFIANIKFFSLRKPLRPSIRPCSPIRSRYTNRLHPG